MWRIESRFEMLADQPHWMLDKGPANLLEGAKFYHGTSAVLEPGDIIEPRNSSPWFTPYWQVGYSDPELPIAFATTSLEEAKDYAEHAAEFNQSNAFVYLVAPVSPSWGFAQGPRKDEKGDLLPVDDPELGEMWEYGSPDMTHYISSEGWKVIDLVETIPYSD